MDWFTLVLIFLFFILPVIQQVLEQSRRKGGEAPVEQGDSDNDIGPLEQGDDRPAVRSERSVPPAKQGDGGWSGDWTPWPTEGTTEEPARQEPEVEAHAPDVWVPTYDDPEEIEFSQTAPEVAPEPRLAEIRTAAELPQPVLAAPILAGPRRTPAVLGHRRSRTGGARLDLDGPKNLRRAIILNEVLGPPAALRPVERELPW